MSSMKRDVKKKLRLDRRTRFFLEIQPTPSRYSEEVCSLSILVSGSLLLVAEFECGRRIFGNLIRKKLQGDKAAPTDFNYS
jgi:hypothetical protein